METQDFKIICIETLNSFHDFKNQGDRLVLRDMQCRCCKQAVDIEVVKTASGFGFINGNLLEPENGQILVQCAQCAKTSPKING